MSIPIPAELRASARSTYRLLFRTAANTFRGDDQVLNAFREKVRSDFREGRSIVDPDAYAARIQLGREVADVLRKNIVQGVKVDSAGMSSVTAGVDGGLWRLRLTEDTELGSNESIKSDRSMAAQRAVGGQKCCQSSSASESASASAAASSQNESAMETGSPCGGPTPATAPPSACSVRATLLEEIRGSLDSLDYDDTYFLEHSRTRSTSEKRDAFLSDVSDLLDELESFTDRKDLFSEPLEKAEFMSSIAQLLDEYDLFREIHSAHETEWLERNADFLSEVETLAVELLEDLEVDKNPHSSPKSIPGATARPTLNPVLDFIRRYENRKELRVPVEDTLMGDGAPSRKQTIDPRKRRKEPRNDREPSPTQMLFILKEKLKELRQKAEEEKEDGDHSPSQTGEEPLNSDVKQQKKKHNYSTLKRLSQNRVKPELKEEDIEESFVRGSGPGGQSINKTANNVQLLHKPTGIRVTCQETRSLQTNRMLARRKLLEKLDQIENPGLSKEEMKRAKQVERERRRKKKARKKAKEKQETPMGYLDLPMMKETTD